MRMSMILTDAAAVAPVDFHATLGAARREPAALRQRLKQGQPALDAQGTGTLDFAVDVGRRRAVDIDDVAVLDRHVELGLAGLKDRRQVDVDLDGIAVAIADQGHDVRTGRQHTARGSDHLGDPASDDVDRIAPRLRDLPQDRDLVAADRRHLDRHLRPQHEAAVAQQLGDLLLGHADGRTADQDIADERKVDLPVLGNARFHRQIGILVDRDPDDVADAEDRFSTRGRRCRLRSRLGRSALHEGEHHQQDLKKKSHSFSSVTRWVKSPATGGRTPTRRQVRARAGARLDLLHALEAFVQCRVARHRRRLHRCRRDLDLRCG